MAGTPSLRFGLFGTGYWAGQVHAAALSLAPEARFVGVWGRDRARTAAIAAPYGIAAMTMPTPYSATWTRCPSRCPRTCRFRWRCGTRGPSVPFEWECQGTDGRVSVQLTIRRRSANSHAPSCLTNVSR
jgi:hypothetical protein